MNPKVHNDVGFTDIQPHVNELDTRNTDTVLDILATYPFYIFNFETGWLVDNYLDSRTEEARSEFFEWARKGRATVSAFYLNLLTGISSGEELYRATYFAHRLHREHGSNFDFACLTDAPSHSWFLPTLLSDIGINAFAVGSNQTRAPILQHSDLNERSPFHWEGMNGERILKWYSRSYLQLGILTGEIVGSPSMEYLRGSIPQFMRRFQREEYIPDAVMVYGAWVDNAAIPVDGLAPLIERWNSTYEYPKLLVTADSEYFDYIDSTFRDQLPVYRGDAGAYWEDGAASSAKATKINRHTKEVMTAAETIASFGSLFDSRYRYPAEALRKTWDNIMFYDEHTWGALQSIEQPGRELVRRQWEIKENYAREANLTARNILARSLNRLVQHVAVERDMVFVFNLQNWVRSGPVEVEIDEGKYLVELATNKPVPFDELYEEDKYRRIRFLAERVPPMGYKGYGVRALEAEGTTAQGLNAVGSGATIESRYYRLVVDESTGAVRSLVDKEDGRELVDNDAGYLLNQYLYVTGGQDSRILRNFYGRREPQLSVHSPAGGRLIENVKTPYGQRVVVEVRAEHTPTIRTEYVVYDKLKRVDIHNELQKEPVRSKEAVYFAFPFAARKPAFSYQIQNGWVRPNEDQLPGAAREWFATQNLVRVQDGDFSIAWASPDAPLVTLTDINRGKWLTHLDVTNGHVFSYVMNNYWFTNYKASQGGEFSFSYSLTSGSGMSLEDLGQFDADARAPVFPYSLFSSFSASVEHTDRPLSPVAESLMTAAAPNTQMVVLKAAEDGEGYILRFRETAGRSGSVELKFPTLEIKDAHLCNGVEVPQKRLEHTSSSITVPFTANGYTTVRIDAEGALAQ
ncbi:MAG: hypothetical protein GEU99_25030 [Luteitalea sp.]|nr:hypothetical protein [Luteitalea sp.]